MDRRRCGHLCTMFLKLMLLYDQKSAWQILSYYLGNDGCLLNRRQVIKISADNIGESHLGERNWITLVEVIKIGVHRK